MNKFAPLVKQELATLPEHPRSPQVFSRFHLVSFITCGCESSAPFCCNLHSQAPTHAILVIGLYGLLGNPTTPFQSTCVHPLLLLGFVLLDLSFYMYALYIVVCPYVLFLFAIVLSVLLRCTDYDYPFYKPGDKS
jgi:hypothetical protein